MQISLIVSMTEGPVLTDSASCVGSTDWGVIFEVLLGAFVGFISTGLTSWIIKRVQINKLIKKISLEVKSSLQGLEQISEHDVSSYTMASPIWDVIPTSSVLLDLPTEKYLKLITIYMEVKKFNKEEEDAQKLIERGISVDVKKTLQRRQRLISIMKNNQL